MVGKIGLFNNINRSSTCTNGAAFNIRISTYTRRRKMVSKTHSTALITVGFYFRSKFFHEIFNFLMKQLVNVCVIGVNSSTAPLWSEWLGRRLVYEFQCFQRCNVKHEVYCRRILVTFPDKRLNGDI